MVAKRGAASGNARTARSKKAATSAAAVAAEEAAPAPKGGWGLKGAATQPDPESDPAPEGEGVGLDGRSADAGTAADETVTPKARRGGRKANAGHTPAQDASDDGALNLTNMTNDLVKGVEQLERLAEEIGALKDDAKEFMSALKSKGYSTKIIRKAISRRAMDPDKRNEEDSLLDLYEEALRGSGQDE